MIMIIGFAIIFVLSKNCMNNILRMEYLCTQYFFLKLFQSCKVAGGEDSEPNYARTNETADETIIYSPEPYQFVHGGEISDVNIAYEAWGQLNEKKDNVVILHHGLSASAHAKSNSVSL